MKNLLRTIFILNVATVMWGCPVDKNYPISLRNKSTHDIYVYYARSGLAESMYPDTLLPKNVNLRHPIKPGYYHSEDVSGPWSNIYKHFPQDTMSVFIFHADTLDKYSWEQIREDYNILARYDLSYEDLKNRNMKLTYPWNTQY